MMNCGEWEGRVPVLWSLTHYMYNYLYRDGFPQSENLPRLIVVG